MVQALRFLDFHLGNLNSFSDTNIECRGKTYEKHGRRHGVDPVSNDEIARTILPYREPQFCAGRRTECRINPDFSLLTRPIL
jgi:hypothetical protein